MDIFNTSISRKGTYCTQWDFCEDRFGVKDVLPFSISDMDLPIPEAIIRTLKKRLEHPILGYSRWQHDDYLNSIVNWYHQQYKTEIQPEWITYSPSVMYSISKAIEILTLNGDNILIFTPVYNAFFDVIKHNGRNMLTTSLMKENGRGYVINWQDFELKIKSAKMVLLCNPHNPTGTVWSEDDLHRIAACCARHNIWLCSDEIHSDFVFNHSFTSALTIKDDKVVVFNSISKTFNVPALTGSYMISTDDNFNHKFRTISRYRDFVNSPSVLNVIATIVAYNECEEWLKSLKVHIASNIQFTLQYLNENIPELIVWPAEGCYFSWVDCSALGYPFDKFYRRLINEGRVGIMAGHVYGTEGEGYLRLNLACSREKLYMGLAFMRNEHKAVEEVIDSPLSEVANLIKILQSCQGKVVFIGVGKSGIIARKLAATFASTGTPSFFVHGTEAVHGDLGMVAKDDVVILISNSGETAEILATLPSLKKMGNYLISFTRSHHSSLAISCDLSVEIPVKSEADNLGLAPSCSSTVVLVVGDAVALALSELKKFTRADFGLYHPGGALGIKANS
ncbi:putative C-S lyase [Escherichia coli]|nr:putative C-S lyase [Escherichia coli]EFE1581711.1 putative C-S lyase [Escherichia coli]EFM7829388.1 putative C-S lyase [Escherichia coli]PBS02318.1 sigma factor regulator FecR [Escherichia coli]HAO9555045.1 putative C-S lyase [Escherichia coli]